MLDRQKIRNEISAAAMARWNQLNEIGVLGGRGLVAAEAADIAMAILDAAGAFGPKSAPTEVWYWSNDDETSSAEVYLDAEAAKDAAIADLKAIDPGAVTGDEQYTWRTVEKLPNSHLLDEDGTFTGWSVNRLPVVTATAKAGA